MSDELRTERLLLRRWRPEDAEPMAAINRDPEVTRFLNREIDEAAVAAFHGQMVGHWEEHGSPASSACVSTAASRTRC
jgi:RimJ/RimL family protein N-acetyltransferase